jgi:hypothetical protein
MGFFEIPKTSPFFHHASKAECAGRQPCQLEKHIRVLWKCYRLKFGIKNHYTDMFASSSISHINAQP